MDQHRGGVLALGVEVGRQHDMGLQAQAVAARRKELVLRPSLRLCSAALLTDDSG